MKRMYIGTIKICEGLIFQSAVLVKYDTVLDDLETVEQKVKEDVVKTFNKKFNTPNRFISPNEVMLKIRN